MDKKILRVDLKDDYKERFEKIKIENKYSSDAEVIRALIDQFKLGIDQVKVDVKILDKIRQELKNPLFQIKYGIFTPDEFIIRAIINFFNKIKEERGSILDWEVRSELSESQRGIAIAFFELQTKNPSGLSKKQISDFLNKDELEIENDISYLVKSGLLEHHGTLYYAP